jgi:hypothetical protein
VSSARISKEERTQRDTKAEEASEANNYLAADAVGAHVAWIAGDGCATHATETGEEEQGSDLGREPVRKQLQSPRTAGRQKRKEQSVEATRGQNTSWAWSAPCSAGNQTLEPPFVQCASSPSCFVDDKMTGNLLGLLSCRSCLAVETLVRLQGKAKTK